jgi:hypothetical protein
LTQPNRHDEKVEWELITYSYPLLLLNIYIIQIYIRIVIQSNSKVCGMFIIVNANSVISIGIFYIKSSSSLPTVYMR